MPTCPGHGQRSTSSSGYVCLTSLCDWRCAGCASQPCQDCCQDDEAWDQAPPWPDQAPPWSCRRSLLSAELSDSLRVRLPLPPLPAMLWNLLNDTETKVGEGTRWSKTKGSCDSENVALHVVNAGY